MLLNNSNALGETLIPDIMAALSLSFFAPGAHALGFCPARATTNRAAIYNFSGTEKIARRSKRQDIALGFRARPRVEFKGIMSRRFVVRKSHFRHVFGQAAKKDKSYHDVGIQCNGEGNHIAANEKYIIFATTGGGGPCCVIPYGKTGRIGKAAPKLNAHTAKVLDFAFNPFVPHIVASCGEDCMVAVSTLPADPLEFKGQGGDRSTVMQGHDKKVDLIAWSPTAHGILATCSHDGTVRVWDAEEGKQSLSLGIGHECNSLTWNRDGSQLAVTCPDKKMRLWDPRAPTAVAKISTGMRTARSLFHEKVGLIGCGGSVMGTRQYNLYDIKKLGSPVREFEIDDAAGMMLTYYDPDTSVLYIGGKGGAQVKYFELTDKAEYMYKLAIYSMKAGVKGMKFLPKLMCNWQKCVIAKSLMVYRDWINPVEFIVPRKSQLFAEHLYPDAYAGVASLTGSDWLGGQNKAPILKSMDPKKQTNVAGGVKIITKSKAELVTENKALHAKVKQLEQEIARLKSQ